MLLHKKTTLLFLIFISYAPISGMIKIIRKNIYLTTKFPKKTSHLYNCPISANLVIKEFSNEELEELLRNNHLSPNNLQFALANRGKVTPSQIEAINEFKERQRNREWYKEKETE